MFRRIGYRPIPTKKVINGDVREGMRYTGQAMKQLLQLENAMRFQGLKQLSSTFKDDNVVIECWHGFGQSQVTITVGGGGEERGGVCKKCLCGCHVSLGFIKYDGPLECIEHITDQQLTYDVIACQKKSKYIELSDCQPTDFTRFADGDKVYLLWVPGEGETYETSKKAGCIMETTSWARILSIRPKNNKFNEYPC